MTVMRGGAAIDFAALDDSELVAQVRAGRAGAFRQVMQRCNQRMYRVVRGALDDEHEIEDVMQEAYVKAFEKIDGFRLEASLATWLCRIALNEAFERLRRRRPTVDFDTLDESVPEMGNVIAFPRHVDESDPAAAAAREEMRHILERAVAQLPPAFRSVFLLREVEGCSTEETAELLDLRIETVKTRLHRARRLLQEHLRERAEAALDSTFPFLGWRCGRLTETVLLRLAGRFASDR